MAEIGIEIPNGKEIEVLEETKTQKYIALPHLNDDRDTFTDDFGKKKKICVDIISN